MAKGKEGVLDGTGSDENDRRKSHKRRKDRSTDDEDEDGTSSESSDGCRDRHKSRRAGKEKKSRRKARKRSSRRRSSSELDDDEDYSSSSSSYSESESDSETEESEEEARRRRRKRKERRRREREEEERRRRKRKREKKRRKEEEEEKKRRKKKKKEKALGKTGAVTNSWGKYGIIRETDMWNKRPEFTAWLAEIKQVNLESLSNWEEKQMFKEFMEDHNTATFPSKKYYDLEAYHHRQMQKEWKKGAKKNQEIERTVFNDEEQRRQELLKEREKMKEQQVEVLKRSMQSGMAQAMKEQQLLKEEMAYQYKLGNFEAAAAIQRRLDPDAAM